MGPKESKSPPGKIGGLIFLLTLLVFVVLAGGCLIILPPILYRGEFRPFLEFLFSGIIGAAAAKFLLRAHISVFLHEFKHMLSAILAGNKAKGIKVARDSGHFEYAYSKDTEGYNAFISLAPYYIPLFTAPALLLSIIFLRANPDESNLLVGAAYGADLLLNMRDISPRQSDFSALRGGFIAGVIYVAAVNLVILSLILAWTVQGIAGIHDLVWGVFVLLSRR